MVKKRESDENVRWCPMSKDTCWDKDCVWWAASDDGCSVNYAFADLAVLGDRLTDLIEGVDELKDVMESVITRDGDLSVVVM